MGRELIEGTDYQLLSVHPDFTYHPKQKIIGVWADFLSTTLGIPAYTLNYGILLLGLKSILIIQHVFFWIRSRSESQGSTQQIY